VVSTLEKTGELPDLAGVAVVACLPRPRTAAFSEAEERQAVAVFTAVTEQSGGTFKAVECSQPALQRALQEVP
jgi:predicted benzoate:H+ symporter BenE